MDSDIIQTLSEQLLARHVFLGLIPNSKFVSTNLAVWLVLLGHTILTMARRSAWLAQSASSQTLRAQHYAHLVLQEVTQQPQAPQRVSPAP